MQIFELFGAISVDTQEANSDLQTFDSGAKKSGANFGKIAGGIATASMAVVASIGAIAVGVGALAVKFSDDLQGAMNQLQASTGKTTEDMDELNQAMVNVYNNNFGESFEDISNVMGNVTQVIGGTAEEIQKVTENAYLMNDVFGIDTEISINAVNSLMKNFGITSEEAFNLITIGAQNGANKNGDLIDTLNEYAPAFSNIGLTAKNFTSVLISGAENGAFSIDKIGDAMKEFEIRAQDYSDSTHQAFEELGLETVKMRKAFAEGGETGAQAFQTVIDKIIAMEKPTRQNLVGVQLFGTMFEDLGPKGIKALKDISKEVVNTEGALDSMNEIKYDTFGEAMEGLKRNMETGILLPLGELVLPLLNRFADWISDYMPVIQTTFDTVFSFIVDRVIPPFVEWLNLIRENVLPELKKIVDIVINTVRDIFDENIGFIRKEILPPLLSLIRNFYENIMPKLLNVIQTYLPLIMEFFKDAIGFIVREIIPPLITIIKFFYEVILPALIEYTQESVENMVIAWTWFKENVLPILKWFWDTSKLTFETVTTIIKTSIGIINGAIDSFKGLLVAVVTYFKGGFLKDITAGAKGIVNIFSEQFNQLSGIVKRAMNSVIGIVNRGIAALNKLKVTIPSEIPGIGGRTIGINVSPIPMLAKGGKLLDNGMAIVGENGPELISNMKGASVIPLDKKGGISIIINNPTIIGDNAGDSLGEELINTLGGLGVI